MVRVAAVDVEKNRDVATLILTEYGFELKGVPTIVLLKPKVYQRGLLEWNFPTHTLHDAVSAPTHPHPRALLYKLSSWSRCVWLVQLNHGSSRVLGMVIPACGTTIAANRWQTVD